MRKKQRGGIRLTVYFSAVSYLYFLANSLWGANQIGQAVLRMKGATPNPTPLSPIQIPTLLKSN